MADPSDYAAARRYLAPLHASPWRWDDEAQVVEWTDGTTIAFRPELEEILRRLAPRGLPPFTALLWLLAACHDTWHETAGRLAAKLGLAASLGRSDLPEWLPEIMRRLDAVRALPADLRHDPGSKALLAETVFEDARLPIAPEEAARVVGGLTASSNPAMLLPQPDSSRPADLPRELRCLYDGLAKVDAEALRLRRQTGLDALVRPADVDLAPAERIRRLIAALRDDAELGGVARVAGQLLAAIHLPRPIADHEDLPVGGMSDIANRGPLDRLLISELAQDDLTLAVRVAMNEALYLRRETPPCNPPRQRAVLIDAGIRLWGIPRVFATAVAMAIAATAERNMTVDVYRAEEKDVVPVDLTSRKGLVEHLGALAPEAHPGDCLVAFREAVSASDSPADLVVITGEDVAADREFGRALAALASHSVFLATVRRDGRFRMAACGAKSRREVLEARLELDTLLAPRPLARTSVYDKRHSADLPAILAVEPFPLLFSYQAIRPDRHWAVKDAGVLGISYSRCLMHWQPGASAARLLADNMPSEQVHWTTSSGLTSFAVIGQLQRKNLWLLNIDVPTATCQLLPLECGPEQPKHFCGHGGMAFVIYDRRVDVFETYAGRKRHTVDMGPGHRSWQGRLFASYSPPARGCAWRAICYDGLSLRFEPVFSEPQSPEAQENYIALVEVDGHDGPVGIREDGSLYDSAHNRVIRCDHQLEGVLLLRAVAADGRRVVLAEAGTESRMALVELPSGRASRVYGDPAMLVEPEFGRLKPLSLRKRFLGIGINHAGRLTLVARRGQRVQLTPLGMTLQLVSDPGIQHVTHALPIKQFVPLPAQPARGYSLKVATWEDGSRAFLDSRGMLHLKSSDAAIPELTLVLHERELAGWCADGRAWGPSCFTGTANGTDPEAIYANVLKPFLERLR